MTATKHHQESIHLTPGGPGVFDFTGDVKAAVHRAGVDLGVATVFLRHTSASLIIQENADPDVKRDLEVFLRRLVPEGDPLYRHVDEGPDDMPAHVKAALTATMVSVPIRDGRMVLGTWQGIFLWEHRRRPGRREVVVHVTGESG